MNAAVIVAAGRGTRMGLEKNKVLFPVCGEPVIVHTVRAFARSGLFDGGIVVVTGEADMEEMRGMMDAAGNEILPAEYLEIRALGQDRYLAVSEDRLEMTDADGGVLWTWTKEE